MSYKSLLRPIDRLLNGCKTDERRTDPVSFARSLTHLRPVPGDHPKLSKSSKKLKQND